MNRNVSKRFPWDATLINASSNSFCFFVGSIFTKPLHRYFAVMYLRLSSEFESGFNFFQPLCSPDSQTALLTFSFPPKFTTICICVTGIESISNDRIFDTATPSDLCIPLHACIVTQRYEYLSSEIGKKKYYVRYKQRHQDLDLTKLDSSRHNLHNKVIFQVVYDEDDRTCSHW